VGEADEGNVYRIRICKKSVVSLFSNCVNREEHFLNTEQIMAFLYWKIHYTLYSILEECCAYIFGYSLSAAVSAADTALLAAASEYAETNGQT